MGLGSGSGLGLVRVTWVELKKMPLGGAFRKRCGRAASTPEMKAMVFSC